MTDDLYCPLTQGCFGARQAESANKRNAPLPATLCRREACAWWYAAGGCCAVLAAAQQENAPQELQATAEATTDDAPRLLQRLGAMIGR